MWVEKNGPTFRIRELIGDKKVTLGAGYETRTAAKDAMTGLRSDQLRGDLINPQDGKRLLKSWATEWWIGHQIGLKPNTVRTEGCRLEGHVIADLGELALSEITPAVVQTWVADMMAGGLGAKSVHNTHGLLHTVLSYAVDNRLIRTNPCERTKLPLVEHREMRFLTETEAQRLLDAMPAQYRDVVVMFLGTGMRWGEVAGLQVRRFDAFTRTLMVIESLVDRGLILGTPKSRAGRRAIATPDDVTDALIKRSAGKSGTDWMFQQPRGGPMRHGYFYMKVWQPAAKKAGLAGLRIHDLRHTHAAWLISANMPLTAIQRRLGHKSIAITSDRYGHLMPEVDDDIVGVLNLALKGHSPRGKLGESAVMERRTTACNCAQLPAQRASVEVPVSV